MTTFFAGLSLGFSLIVAIGSQNAFVLKQGIKKHYIFAVCLICALSDAILISLGVAGFGTVVEKFPAIETFARYGGALFLLTYSILSFKSAFFKDQTLNPEGTSKASFLKTISICLAFTWLNPHVYLDTVVLLGSVSTQYHPHQLHFAIGAMTASFIFFFSLGFGARILEPLFKKPISWKILDFLVGIIMLLIAIKLIRGM